MPSGSSEKLKQSLGELLGLARGLLADQELTDSEINFLNEWLEDRYHMTASFPLEAAGLVGQDADGDWILADCKAHGIDTAQLRQTADAHTSYTDAMTVASTGRRTFFLRPLTGVGSVADSRWSPRVRVRSSHFAPRCVETARPTAVAADVGGSYLIPSLPTDHLAGR